MNRLALLSIALAVAAGAAHGQQSPYTGFQDRTIKARSAQEIDDLMNGRGMGYALAAELNGYPGPRHVLDLADSLGLTDDQRLRVQSLYDRMQHRAVDLGRRIVTRERALDSLFANGQANAVEVASAVDTIGMLEGRLRAVHLRTHIEMMQVLTPPQVAEYGRLRGYGARDGHDSDRHDH